MRTDQAENSPIFAELVREQARLLGRGEIGVDNFSGFMVVANQISGRDCGDSVVYAGPDGRTLNEADAGPLYHARSPEAWVLASEDSQPELTGQADAKLTSEQLSVVANVFDHYCSTPVSEIPKDVEAELNIAHERTVKTLGITDPNLALNEVADAIRRRQQLSRQVAAGEHDHLFLPRLLREYRASRGATAVTAAASQTAKGRKQIVAVPDSADPEADERQRQFDSFLGGGRVIGEEDVTGRRRKGVHRRRERGRWLARAALPALVTAGVGVGLRMADVVPFGSVGIGAATGAVGMMITTRLNKEVWGRQETRWQKLRALGKAALAGAGIGAAVAAGAMLVTDVASAAIDALRNTLADNSSATFHQIPSITPEPTVPDQSTQPVPPVAFDSPMQTESLGHFDGTDGPDNNPWMENTGYDTIADRLDAEYQRATGQPIDWSAINGQAYHNFVGEVLEQNGLGWSDVMHPGDSLTIDAQHALDFLRAHVPGADLDMAGTRV